MYEILIEKNAEKELDKLNSPIFESISKAILNLSIEPRPQGCKKLKGLENDWRLRVGSYRILYELNDKMKQIKINSIRHRKDVYK